MSLTRLQPNTLIKDLLMGMLCPLRWSPLEVGGEVALEEASHQQEGEEEQVEEVEVGVVVVEVAVVLDEEEGGEVEEEDEGEE